MTDAQANNLTSPTAEEYVIGCLLMDPSLNDECILSDADFTVSDYRKIFKLIRVCRESGKTPDVTVLMTLVETDHAELRESLFTIFRQTAGTTNFPAYQSVVREKTLRRRMVDAARQIDVVARGPDTVDNALNFAQSTVMDISIGKSGDTVTGGEGLVRLIDQMDRLATGQHGIQTGFASVDSRIRGLKAGEMIIVAGRPSMGKTTYALQIAGYAAIAMNKRVMVFSLEMPVEQLIAKLISCGSNIPMDDFNTGKAIEHPSFLTAAQKVKTDNLIIDDTAGATINAISSKARKQARRGLDLIVIDYLGLIRGSSDSRVEDMTRISAGVKSLARELKVPVIALSQLNRNVEVREDKRPQLSDLRESGALEQDADIIQFLYRDEYYNPKPENAGVAEVITRKFRMGQVGTDILQFDGAHSRFRSPPPGFVHGTRPDGAFA